MAYISTPLFSTTENVCICLIRSYQVNDLRAIKNNEKILTIHKNAASVGCQQQETDVTVWNPFEYIFELRIVNTFTANMDENAPTGMCTKLNEIIIN